MKITAISGSLREQSSNTALLRTLAALAPDNVEITLFDGLDDLPYFSPERDIDLPPEPVSRLREALRSADGVIFSTPEYAHGIPGSLKNALDWVVGSGELSQKPVAAMSASPSSDGGSHAHAALVEVLTTMDARVVTEASRSIGVVRAKLGSGGDSISPELRQVLSGCLAALYNAMQQP